MRTLKISLLVFILSITISAQWEWKNPDPQANDLLDSYFIDDLNGWAVGYYGACIKTTDGGETWQNPQMPINTNFQSVQFLDINRGFIGDWDGNLLKTTDGGITWDVQPIDNYANIFIFFTDQTFGWILSSNIVTSTFKVYRTSDGGNSWQSHVLPITRDLHDIYFIDSTKGFVISNLGDILMTTDGGVSWNYAVSPTQEQLWKITFKNSQEGFIVGTGGSLLETSDGGMTWINRPHGQDWHSDISFFDEMNGILLGGNSSGPKVYLTSDGGTTWIDRTHAPISTPGLRSCNYLSETDCIIFGTFGEIYKTTNQGNSWTDKLEGAKSAMADLIFLNTLIGFTVGSEGTLLKTFDGGHSWYIQVPLTNENLKSITFSDDIHGWAVGTNSVLLKSTTGGIGWIPDSIPDCNDLFSVDFINNNIGWVVGNYSKILKTTDSGNTWVQQPVNVNWTIDFTSISMIDENIGYACGNYRSFQPPRGIIIKTTNGGIEWDSLKYFDTSFKSIFFQNSLNGWAVGITQHITIHTTDGGLNWINIPIDGGNDIYFESNLKGIKVSYGALGSDITITTDGGNTWIQQPRITSGYLAAGYVIDNNFWAVGTHGIILNCNNPIVTNSEYNNSGEKFSIDYRLSQNFPNPFNPVTSIQYAISSRQFITLKVYDLLGREIATLVNEEKPAGEYEIEFSAASHTGNVRNLPSGIYFYQLKAGSYSETKKMVLLR